MNTHIRVCWLLLASLLSVGMALADDAKPNAAQIAPFLDDETILVVRIDLEQIDVQATAEWFRKLLITVPDFRDRHAGDFDRNTDRLAAWLDKLRQAGAKQVYGVLSLIDVPQAGPFVVIPIAEGGNAGKVTELVLQGPHNDANLWHRHAGMAAQDWGIVAQEKAVIDGAVVLGATSSISRLKEARPAKRPLLLDALNSDGDATVRVVFGPSADHRRVLREMLPSLGGLIPSKGVPLFLQTAADSARQAIQEINGAALADGVQWAVLDVNLPPKSSVRLIVRSKDATSAAQLHTVVTQLHDIAGELVKQVRPMFPTGGEHTPAEVVDMLLSLGEELLSAVESRLQDDRFMLAIDESPEHVTALAELINIPLQAARKSAQRNRSMNNLKHISLALLNHHDANKSFPPAASVDKKGNKLLSWRVHILPYLEQQALYDKFRLDEPWDSEHNRKLIPQMPAVLASPYSGLQARGLSNYLAPVGENLAFTGKGEGIPIKEFTDGTSMTIMVVEADPKHAVIWTKPDDLEVDLNNPTHKLSSDERRVFLTAFADGSVQAISNSIDVKTLWELFTRNGGEVVNR